MSIKQAKEHIKKVMPKQLQYLYKLFIIMNKYLYDAKRYARCAISNAYSEHRLKRDLSIHYHVVEKGLTMPEIRPGFGQKNIIDLITMIFEYDKLKFSKESIEFRQAISVVKEYEDFHKSLNHTFDEKIIERLKLLNETYSDIEEPKQIIITKEQYFQNSDKSFDMFCNSRHSVRNYTNENIPINDFMDCIKLAQSSPSFCNRQPSRVHIVKSAEKKKKILELQGGNRGFGHLADTILVITSDVTATLGPDDRFANHLNSGMFCMTLLNALHFKRIGACSLNWSRSNATDTKLRDLIDIADNEVVVMLISCGYVPDIFKITASPHKLTEEITYKLL